ncbi:MAG: diacylglycerol kinase family protein [Clostridia bacterium]|nr:diacylglycerol kinase family protein [Clostridia bacterium]
MAKNTSFVRSIKHALRGFHDALIRERNLRIHIIIGDLICFFAAHYGLNRSRWAVLLTIIGVVISSELLNSAIEKAVDTATREYRADAMHAKDFGAAATLVSAFFALAAGVALFGDFEKIKNALKCIFTSPVSASVLILLTAFNIRIILLNGKNKKLRRKK